MSDLVRNGYGRVTGYSRRILPRKSILEIPPSSDTDLFKKRDQMKILLFRGMGKRRTCFRDAVDKMPEKLIIIKRRLIYV